MSPPRPRERPSRLDFESRLDALEARQGATDARQDAIDRSGEKLRAIVETLESEVQKDRENYSSILERIDETVLLIKERVGDPVVEELALSGSGLCRGMADTKAAINTLQGDLATHMRDEETQRKTISMRVGKLEGSAEVERTGKYDALKVEVDKRDERRHRWALWAVGALVTLLLGSWAVVFAYLLRR